MDKEVLYIGVKGSVVCFRKDTGEELWRTKLKGGSFVTLSVDEKRIFAHTRGLLYALDKTTGGILWENGLKGLGYDLATILTEGNSDMAAAQAQQMHAQQAAIAASVTAVSTTSSSGS